MKVRLAAQLLLRSVAIAIDFCKNTLKSEFHGSEATTRFLMLANDVFDIFNSINFLSHGLKKPLLFNNKDEIFRKTDEI